MPRDLEAVALEGVAPEGIAIVGMAARFPEAPDLGAFWENLRAGRESVHFFSDAELAALGLDAAALRAMGHVAALPRIENPGLFDARFFGYTPDQAAVIDPQHRLFLEVCWEALENAGRNPRGVDGRAGVFGGQAIGNYLVNNLAPAGRLGPAEYFSTVVANGPDFLCSRVSFVCNLTGPCVTVQAACATGLVAVHLACQSLLNFECDIALAGGVALQLLGLPGHFYDGGKSVYSPDGHSRVFDEQAGGTLFGDGCGIVVLRRLEDAVKDGDSIRAVIRGSAINNSGTVAAGFNTPSAGAQEDATVDALAAADVRAESIGYLELHGSGTRIGDAIEVGAMTRAFRRTTRANGYCGIGAVKSNVGHLGAAAGMASLCKAVLAVEHDEIPPTILVDRVNPDLALERTPFHLVLTPERWTSAGPRRAGVNSYGVGGTNAHVILEQAPAIAARSSAPGPHLLVLSAATPAALRAASDRLAAHLEAQPGIDVADVAWTLATGRTELHHRRALVCRGAVDAIGALRADGGEGSRAATPPAAALSDGLVAVGQAWVRGADVDWPAVFGKRRRRVALPSYPFERTLHWIDPPRHGTPVGSFGSFGTFGSLSTTAERPERSERPERPERPTAAPPTSPLEETVCALWRSVTGVADAGIDDNFFALGGSSLQLANVHATLRSTVLADLTVVDVFMNPTVRTLVRQIERIQADPSAAGQLAQQVGGLQMAPPGRLSALEMGTLRSDARLAGDIRPAGPYVAGAPENILLTGATGFLGVFLLAELLASTRATIYCHVRASTRTAGLDRIQTAMQSRSLWVPEHASRIVPVCGDLSERRLGVSAEAYADLVDRIDTIVHNGALVNFTPPYATLKPINVDGTEDVLRLACTGPTKAVHFISSNGVWAGRFPVAENDPLDEIDGLENGYTQTKWVSERLVQEAADRGLPVTIHRPPRVVGDSRTGSANLDDFVARVIKGCAELGAAPQGHFFDILAPVDFVARAIVAIAFSPEATALQRFHIVHPELATWRTILDYMPIAGIPLEMLPYESWRQRLFRHCQDHDNALKPLLPLFRKSDAGGYAEIPDDVDLSGLPGVPCENATAILAPAGIACPPIDAALLDVYFRYFFEVGYLVRPS